MLPQIPATVNKLIQDQQGQLSTYPFPDNIAGHPAMTKELRQTIFRWMLDKYIWPQIMERQSFEAGWDKLLQMARATWKLKGADLEKGTRLKKRKQARILDKPIERGVDADMNERIEVSDTVIFDAIDRMTNLSHFISYKESLPVQYNIPDDMIFPYETESYSPMSALTRSANCWLRFNSQNQNVYRKDLMSTRHHYTYGCCFINSEFVQKIDQVPRRQPDKSFAMMLELTEIGITFEPMSIRKLWLNWRLPVDKMDFQACPFFFEQMPRFAIIANRYDPQMNPFGFMNQAELQSAQYLFGSAELSAYMKAFEEKAGGRSPADLLPAEYATELLWTFYPMLPLTFDEQSQQFAFDEDGTKGIPQQRFIVQTFGNNLCNGGQEIVRLQRNFYPHDSIPLYGSAHLPSLDDGAYPDAIGTILEGHYHQICKALMQFLENKDWANDPPTEVMVGSPAVTHDINKKGAKIPVNGPNDIKRREPCDLTQTTPTFLQMLRDQAKTSSKTVDAIMGKAMGSRTSATEATNAFQTAMSGVTTDVNIRSYDIHGGYATRVWDYTGRWVDPDVLAAITGSYGFQIKPEHLSIRLGLKWDCGSTFVETITRQSNLRYILESSVGDPSINRAALWSELLTLWKFKDVRNIVNDGGRQQQIQFATEQAIQTYLGQQVIIDPDQDHLMAIQVKKSFLKDRNSVWNTTPQYVVNGQFLVQQIVQHQLYHQLMVQMQQMQMIQQATLGIGGGDPGLGQALQSLQNVGGPQTTGGQMAQAQGGRL